MKTHYSQALRPSSAARIIQSTTRYRPLRQGATLLSFQSQNSAVGKASARAETFNKFKKKSLGNNGLFSQVIAHHHHPRPFRESTSKPPKPPISAIIIFL
ncbi:hypothetical protein [Rhizobium sp. WYCCWR10014]|uniref:hypothetical protein n=1 Tax=Rhizobium sp. WYCCWR10014 TaxID=1825933 RepID=UPI0012E7EEFA|nr:hypothetical protein [Rhizobium sp. WYCCWR10014]